MGLKNPEPNHLPPYSRLDYASYTNIALSAFNDNMISYGKNTRLNFYAKKRHKTRPTKRVFSLRYSIQINKRQSYSIRVGTSHQLM